MWSGSQRETADNRLWISMRERRGAWYLLSATKIIYVRYYTNVGFRGLTICQLIFLRYYEPRRLMLRQLNRTSLVNKGFITWQEYCTRELPIKFTKLVVFFFIWWRGCHPFAPFCGKLRVNVFHVAILLSQKLGRMWTACGMKVAIGALADSTMQYFSFLAVNSTTRSSKTGQTSTTIIFAS